MALHWLKQHWDECLFGGIVIAMTCQVFQWLWPEAPIITPPSHTTALNSEEARLFATPTRYKMASTVAVKKENADISMLQIAPDMTLPVAHAGQPAGLHKPLGPVNVNQATADQLEALPGIGPKLALRIVAYRQKQRIASASDLDKVKGIGPALLAKLEPYLQF
jgi:competence ComEA-like helix-hairpin-helix protein